MQGKIDELLSTFKIPFADGNAVQIKQLYQTQKKRLQILKTIKSVESFIKKVKFAKLGEEEEEIEIGKIQSVIEEFIKD